jgi:hypothetical protein
MTVLIFTLILAASIVSGWIITKALLSDRLTATPALPTATEPAADPPDTLTPGPNGYRVWEVESGWEWEVVTYTPPSAKTGWVRRLTPLDSGIRPTREEAEMDAIDTANWENRAADRRGRHERARRAATVVWNFPAQTVDAP